MLLLGRVKTVVGCVGTAANDAPPSAATKAITVAVTNDELNDLQGQSSRHCLQRCYHHYKKLSFLMLLP